MMIRKFLLPFFLIFSNFLPFKVFSLEVGIGTHFQSYSKQPQYYLDIIKKYGFTSFRDDYTWSRVEAESGKYEVSKYIQKSDAAFMDSRNQNLNSMLILDYGNPLYNGGAFPSDDKSIAAFANYAAWTAKRFKGRVKYYEIWNEWTIGSGMVKFKNSIPDAEVYFKLVKETSLAIRKVDPEAIIVAGSINPLDMRARYIKDNDWSWFEKLVKMGMMSYIDGVSLHAYSYMNGNPKLRTAKGNLDFIDNFHKYFSKLNGKSINIYITEIGITSYSGPGGKSYEEVADFVGEYTKIAKTKEYIKGVWWYDLIDDGPDINNREHNFGFLKTDESPKPAALEIKKLEVN